MRFTPIFALGAFFFLVGVVLFFSGLGRKKENAAGVPARKSEVRAEEERRAEGGKLRLAGLLFSILGVVLMLVS